MMGWQRLQVRSNSSRPSSRGSDSGPGTGNGDWLKAGVVNTAKEKAVINSEERIEVERMI